MPLPTKLAGFRRLVAVPIGILPGFGIAMLSTLMVVIVTSATFKPYHITDNFVDQTVLFVYASRPFISFPMPQPFRLP
jgi:hypothetical protein